MYSEAIANRICALVAQDWTYDRIGATDGMPSKSTIMEWMRTRDDFRTKCAHAKVAQADAIDDRMGGILDKTEAGELAPDVARVLLSGLQWRAAKKDPKRYGDKLAVGGDPDAPPIRTESAVRIYLPDNGRTTN